MDKLKLRSVLICIIITVFILEASANVCHKLCICDKTGFVNCSRNYLTKVPTGIPLNTTSLDLSMNNLGHIYVSDFKQLVNLTDIDLSSNNFGDNSIDEGSLDLSKLETLDLSYTNMSSFPSAILPKTLKKLYFIQNNVNSIASNAFENVTLLEYLDMSNNQLQAIPARLFHYLTNLNTLYIPFNNLTNSGIPDDAFVGNKNLTLFGARFNHLEKLLPNLPPSLLYLDYAGNAIKTIQSYAFKSLPNLQSIALWEGQVTVLEEHAFSGLSKLQMLDMMQDTVTSNITQTTFEGLTSLKTLYFDLNNVSYIDPLAFQTFMNVESIWISDNKLTSLDPRVFERRLMPHLSEVYMDGNPWYCDCHLKWLKEISEHPTFVVQDPHLIVCNGPAALKGRAWDQLNSTDFVCV